MTTYQLHKLSKGFIITSNEPITDVRPHKGKLHLEGGQILNTFPTYLTDLSECKLVISQNKIIDLSTLSQPEQDKICWFDVDALQEESYKPYEHLEDKLDDTKIEYRRSGHLVGFREGFQKAQELLYPLLKQTSWNVEVEITESTVKVTKILE